jgi:integrase
VSQPGPYFHVTGNDQPYRNPRLHGWSIRFRYRDADGKTKRGAKHGFKTRNAAIAWRNGLKDADDPSKITAKQLFQRYLAAHDVQKSTLENLRYRLRKFEERYGRRPVSSIRPPEIQEWSLSLEGAARFEATQAVKQALRWGVRMGFIRENPAQHVKNRTPIRPGIQPFDSWAEVEKVASKAGDSGPLIRFLAATGLRLGEVAALTRADIDRSGSTPVVRVTKRLTKDRQIVSIPKNRENRSVPLTPRALAALADVPPRIDTQLLFPAVKGGPLDIHNWRARVWAPALKRAKLEKRGPYALRHTFAAEALRRGLPTYQLGRLMGTSVQMIDKHYGHLLSDSHATILRYLSGEVDSHPDSAKDSL